MEKEPVTNGFYVALTPKSSKRFNPGQVYFFCTGNGGAAGLGYPLCSSECFPFLLIIVRALLQYTNGSWWMVQILSTVNVVL